LLYRYHPDREARGENPLQLDSSPPRIKLGEYRALENRFKMLEKSHPAQAKSLLGQAQEEVNLRWKLYQHLAARDLKPGGGPGGVSKTPATVEN
jgi:pyruvate-ferredoxin/flavodoxin oxidoreductase